MKMQSVLAFAFTCSVLFLPACKEKPDQECLIGDWDVTYAVDGGGDSLIGEDGGYIREIMISFTENKVTWVETDLDMSTGMKTVEPSYGSYLWDNETIIMTIVEDGDTLRRSSTVSITDCDELYLRIKDVNDPNQPYIDIKAQRK
ncbi:MAG: hypothetical protein JNJ90_17750 [Saprospiraceae bacterium]|jgi:hypothetical protein|nr:hypothetical protein [Saprospiraceae bacterium]